MGIKQQNMNIILKEGHNEWTETVNREEHLQAIIEWAIQQIENNFDFEEEK